AADTLAIRQSDRRRTRRYFVAVATSVPAAAEASPASSTTKIVSTRYLNSCHTTCHIADGEFNQFATAIAGSARSRSGGGGSSCGRVVADSGGGVFSAQFGRFDCVHSNGSFRELYTHFRYTGVSRRGRHGCGWRHAQNFN